MDADRFPVQRQLLSSMVHGGCHLFHSDDLPDLQAESVESLASIGDCLLCHWPIGNIILWHWQQADRLECAV